MCKKNVGNRPMKTADSISPTRSLKKVILKLVSCPVGSPEGITSCVHSPAATSRRTGCWTWGVDCTGGSLSTACAAAFESSAARATSLTAVVRSTPFLGGSFDRLAGSTSAGELDVALLCSLLTSLASCVDGGGSAEVPRLVGLRRTGCDLALVAVTVKHRLALCGT